MTAPEHGAASDRQGGGKSHDSPGVSSQPQLGIGSLRLLALAVVGFLLMPRHEFSNMTGEWFLVGWPFSTGSLEVGFLSTESPGGIHLDPLALLNVALWLGVFFGVRRAARMTLFMHSVARVAILLAFLASSIWFFLGVSSVATSLNKSQSASVAQGSAPTTPSVPKLYEPFFNGGRGPEDDPDCEQLRANLPYESISLERTACYGRCPVYRITLYRSGKATLESTQHVVPLGKFEGTVELVDYGRLCYLLEHIDFAMLQTRYQGNWTDDATCIVTTVSGKLSVSVSDYGSVGPIELWSVQQVIDRIKGTIVWKAAP